MLQKQEEFSEYTSCFIETIQCPRHLIQGCFVKDEVGHVSQHSTNAILNIFTAENLIWKEACQQAPPYQ